MQLHKNDMVAFGEGAARQILRVVMVTDGTITLAGATEAGVLRDRHKDKSDPFNYISGSCRSLKSNRARKVFVMPDGQIFDPGPVL